MKPNLQFLLSCIGAFSFVLSAAPMTNAAEVGTGSSFKGPIGLQLYSLRDQFKKDVPQTLDEVQNFGIKYAELAGTYNQSPEDFKKDLEKRNIQAVSAHFPYERYQNDVEGIAKEAKALGLKYVGCAWIPHKNPYDEKTCREAIATFNKAGEALEKHGLKFFYHVHGFEFQPYADGTLLDLMMKETNPKHVHYEMDVFWIVFPGRDPVKLMEKYPNRWSLMHLKDMKKGTQTGALTGGTDVNNDVAIGTGQIDFAPILKAAKKIGVKYYFIEDESSHSEQQIPVSLKSLAEIKF